MIYNAHISIYVYIGIICTLSHWKKWKNIEESLAEKPPILQILSSMFSGNPPVAKGIEIQVSGHCLPCISPGSRWVLGQPENNEKSCHSSLYDAENNAKKDKKKWMSFFCWIHFWVLLTVDSHHGTSVWKFLRYTLRLMQLVLPIIQVESSSRSRSMPSWYSGTLRHSRPSRSEKWGDFWFRRGRVDPGRLRSLCVGCLVDLAVGHPFYSPRSWTLKIWKRSAAMSTPIETCCLSQTH
jgi:hypothetical protein